MRPLFGRLAAPPHAFYCPPNDTSYDGLLLCGGEDIEPWRFGQENWASCDMDPKRDAAELALATSYLTARKPILGICRGLQLLNVVLGGTLFQDLGSNLTPFHAQDIGADADKIHPIHVVPDSQLASWYGTLFHVNSSHHQALDSIGRGLIVTARSESGFVEAAEHETLPVLCVQYHPERMTGTHRRTDTVDGMPHFQWLIDRCLEQQGN